MKHTNQKIIKIISELTSFCYKYNASKITINITNNSTEVIINLKAHLENISQEIIDSSKKLLSSPRCHEIEEYYWNLPGDDDTSHELTLVGMMVDESTIIYDESTKCLEFNLKRIL